MTEQIVVIPSVAFQGYPVHIHLSICRKDARYTMDIQAQGKVTEVPIGISPQELATLNKHFRRAMETLASENTNGKDPTAAEVEERIRPLAEEGHNAFRRVFGDASALRLIKRLQRFDTRMSVEIVSEDFFLPWELIYPVNPSKSLSYEHFWGVNHIVSRIIVQDIRPEAYADHIVIPVISRPRLGLMTYDALPAVVNEEIPFFEELDGGGEIQLFKLHALDPQRRPEGLEEFRGFWDNALDLAHFACHAFYEDDPPDRSHIVLSHEFSISLRDMEMYLVDNEGYPLVIKNHPLVIMNACETGNLNPLYTSHFAAAFLRYGARGVVATECEVPDTFAADFAKQLYTHLLAGELLGESLLATRRYFLEEYHNPSGLMYSMYAPPSIRLARIGD